MARDPITDKLDACLKKRGLMIDPKSYNQKASQIKPTKAIRIAMASKRQEVEDANDSGWLKNN